MVATPGNPASARVKWFVKPSANTCASASSPDTCNGSTATTLLICALALSVVPVSAVLCAAGDTVCGARLQAAQNSTNTTGTASNLRYPILVGLALLTPSGILESPRFDPLRAFGNANPADASISGCR